MFCTSMGEKDSLQVMEGLPPPLLWWVVPLAFLFFALQFQYPNHQIEKFKQFWLTVQAI